MSCAFRFALVRMFTTNGVAFFAIVLNAVASTGPESGALFIPGEAIVWADDSGERSRREASTIPTASEAIAISKA
jgi:hypothetical protein